MKKFGIFGILVLLVAMFASAPAWAGVDYPVSTWAALVSAYTTAANNDTITLTAGFVPDAATFPLVLNLAKNVTFNGNNKTIDASAVTTATNYVITQSGVFSIKGSGAINFNNLTIIPAGATPVGYAAANAIYVAGEFAGNVDIYNCSFDTGTVVRGVVAVEVYGNKHEEPATVGKKHVTIQNSSFILNSALGAIRWRGILAENLRGSSIITVTGNTFSSDVASATDARGIGLAGVGAGSSYGMDSNITISDNFFKGKMTYATVIMNSSVNGETSDAVKSVTFTNNNLSEFAGTAFLLDSGTPNSRAIRFSAVAGNLYGSGVSAVYSGAGTGNVYFGATPFVLTTGSDINLAIRGNLLMPMFSATSVTPSSIGIAGTATASIMVIGGSGDIAITPNSGTLATATISGGGTEKASMTRSVSATATVATVSQTGVITPNAVGGATITVTTADGGKTATCEVSVTATPPAPAPVNPPAPIAVPPVVVGKIPEIIKNETEFVTPDKMKEASKPASIDENIKNIPVSVEMPAEKINELKTTMNEITEVSTTGKKYPKLAEVKKYVDNTISPDTMQQLESFALDIDTGKNFIVVASSLPLNFTASFDKIVMIKVLADKKTKELKMKFDGILEKDGEFTISYNGVFVLPSDVPVAGWKYDLSWMIKDNSDCDLDKTKGRIIDPIVIAEKIAAVEDPKKPGGGGCTAAPVAGYAIFALLLAVPFLLKRKSK